MLVMLDTQERDDIIFFLTNTYTNTIVINFYYTLNMPRSAKIIKVIKNR